MSSLVSIYIGGVLTLGVAVFHTRLYKMFNWSEAFQKIDINNAKIFYTINLALTILFFIIGFLSVFYAGELSESNGLAFGFNVLYSCFWIWRLIWQMTYQRPEKNQKSDPLYIPALLVPLLIAACYIFPVISNFIK